MSHLVSFGTYGMDIGAFTPFLFAFREREEILDLFEMTCGARLLYNYIWVGGVSHDLPMGFAEHCRAFLDKFDRKVGEYNDLLSPRESEISVLHGDERLSGDLQRLYGGRLLCYCRKSGYRARRDRPVSGEAFCRGPVGCWTIHRSRNQLAASDRETCMLPMCPPGCGMQAGPSGWGGWMRPGLSFWHEYCVDVREAGRKWARSERSSFWSRP